MDVDSKRLAAVFFLTGDHAQAPLRESLTIAGAVHISAPAPVTQLVDCQWAGWQCQGYVDTREAYRVLYIFFWQSDFLDDLDEDAKPLDQDGLQALIRAFRGACDALTPLTAVILTHLWQADIDAARRLEPVVLSKDVNTLIEEHFGALYLDDQARQYITTAYDERDVIKTQSGIIIFAGQGEDRWL